MTTYFTDGILIMNRQVLRMDGKRMIADKKAAVIIEEKNLNNDFEKCFSKLLNSKNLQITLSNNIKKLAKPLATEKIINEVKTLLKG